MRTVCAYCQRLISETIPPYPLLDDKRVSHGICLTCAKIENDKLDKMIAAQKKATDKNKH